MAEFRELDFVKEILIHYEEDMITVLDYLDPEEEVNVKYLSAPVVGYKVSFASEIMFVKDVQEDIPKAVILSVW